MREIDSKGVAVAAVAAVAAGSLAVTLWPHRFGFIWRIPGNDKTGHFIVMGLLAFVVVLALAGGRRRIGALVAVAGTLLLVSVEEASQLLLSGRTFSWLDLASSWAGVLTFGTLAAVIVRRRSP